MFAKAYDVARQYTRPVIISIRKTNNKIECGCGAFVIINDEGWVITVAHLWESYLKYQLHAKEILDYKSKVKSIQQDQQIVEKKKQKKIAQLKPNPEWITDHSFWWGKDGVELNEIKPLPEGDLVIGRLDPFNPDEISTYPLFKDPTQLKHGTSLCKLGFPFHEIKASFDNTNNSFKLEPGAVPLPLFPIDGIFTRELIAGKSKDGKYAIKFIETSSPGLRGQSGGPIFDTKGTIWAIQSRTNHLPLGFSPKIMRNGKEVEENQFINVGIGVHPELILSFLQDNGIEYNKSDY